MTSSSRTAAWLTALLLGLAAASPAGAEVARAEVNGDGVLDLSDSVASLAYLFLGGREPVCLDAADANDDGSYNIPDPLFTLAFLFQGGRAPPRRRRTAVRSAAR